VSEITWNEGLIARAISLQSLNRKCVVLVDNCNWTGHECDVLGVTTDPRIIDVEVKISRADLKADAKKDKWWHRRFLGYGPRNEIRNEQGRLMRVEQESLYESTALQHPRKVWKHYYAMPADIWKPELLEFLPSPASGVLLVRHQRNSTTPIVVSVERRATPNKDAGCLKPEQVMDIARLANLRMWEAYKREQAAREEASDFYHGRRQTLVPFQSPQQAA
jgi:hypothetical protein